MIILKTKMFHKSCLFTRLAGSKNLFIVQLRAWLPSPCLAFIIGEGLLDDCPAQKKHKLMSVKYEL